MGAIKWELKDYIGGLDCPLEIHDKNGLFLFAVSRNTGENKYYISWREKGDEKRIIPRMRLATFQELRITIKHLRGYML